MTGGCHCGAITIELDTALAAAQLNPRACDCSFCEKHGAAYISDPDGRLAIAGSGIREYRQGSENARFLLCGQCGVLVAVVFDAETGRYGAVNARCIDAAFGPPRAVSPQKLDPDEKKRRWVELWTPCVSKPA